ncbi:MAG TPA: EamA family transporter [Candidatus Thermoplasmatota archaeon]|nr:EamA family transporter [Candidatus Thermoplasmatota archaeon]
MQRRTLMIVAAFAAVYVIWGSTYLAIRYAVEDMPPFLMAAGRWIIAGVILYAWRRLAGDPAPTLRNWGAAAIVGTALILGGNGLVSWAEIWVPSSLAALIIAIVPLWFALLVWWREGTIPTARVWAGILLGLLGVALLFGPSIAESVGGSSTMLWGTLAILGATISWAAGSVYSKKAPLPKSILLTASMQMIAGSAALALVGVSTGELARVDLASVELRAWLSFWFLVFLGSIVAFSAYVWLLQVVRTELVATYAFVNPIVAVVLGVVFAGEPFSTGTLIASALIVAGVALVVTGGRRQPATPPPPRPAES